MKQRIMENIFNLIVKRGLLSDTEERAEITREIERLQAIVASM